MSPPSESPTALYPAAAVPGDARAGAAGRPVGRLRRWFYRCDQAVSVAMNGANHRLRRTRLGAWLHARHFAQLQVSSIDIALANGGAGLDGLRVAFLSDLHAGPFMDRDDLARVAGLVAAEAPDVVCLGGDLVSATRAQAELLDRALGRLSPPLGLYAVPGNHEYHDGSTYDQHARFLAGYGAAVLVNSGVRISRPGGGSLWLAGVDDLARGRPDLARALAGRRPGEPVVLLSHNPDLFAEAAAADVDLMLSGHTHGGQIRLFGWAPVTHSRCGFVSGHYRRGRSQLYLGRGVGTAAVPVRFGAPAEIPIVRLCDGGAGS